MNNMKKVLIACDSFKGSLSSKEICSIFEKTCVENKLDLSIKSVEVADGGEGTLSAVLSSGRFDKIDLQCNDPLFNSIETSYAIRGNVAFIESAQASGLTLIDYKDGNGLITSTFGTGEQIADAIDMGANEIYIGLGGTATNDCGVGALSALGFSFIDERGNSVLPVGENLDKIKKIEFKGSESILNCKFVLVSDVDNPLVGKNGATLFYGKQKGIVGQSADIMERKMQTFADLLENYSKKPIRNLKGSGAAGGFGAGFIALLNAEVVSGIECILDLVNFDELLSQVDAVVTGEGRLDEQSFHGKAVSGICKRAEKYEIPIYIFAGSSAFSLDEIKNRNIKAVQTACDYAESIEDSIRNAEKYAYKAAKVLLNKIVQTS